MASFFVKKKRRPEGRLEFVYPSYDLLVVRGVQVAGGAALVVATQLVVVCLRLVLQISVIGLASAAICCAELASVCTRSARRYSRCSRPAGCRRRPTTAAPSRRAPRAPQPAARHVGAGCRLHRVSLGATFLQLDFDYSKNPEDPPWPRCRGTAEVLGAQTVHHSLMATTIVSPAKASFSLTAASTRS